MLKMPIPRSSRQVPCTRVSGLLLSAVSAVLAGTAWAAQPVPTSAQEERMSPEDALKILLGDAAPALSRPAVLAAPAVTAAPAPRVEPAAAGAALKVVVRPGDTVDSLLRRHLGDSVFSTKFQRQALMRLNPTVFQNGQVHRLPVGATLWVPTDTILMGLLPDRKDAVAATARTASAAPAPAADAPAAGQEPALASRPTRGWVRFP